MSKPQVYTHPVPEGFPAMSLPVETETRMKNSDIELSLWKEEDLITLAELLYEAFPLVWWNQHEDETLPLDERVRRMAVRCMRPILTQQGIIPIKATLKSTNQLVGMAVWYDNSKAGNGPTTYPDMPGVTFPTTWLPIVFRETNPETLGWTAKMGWSEEERRGLSSHLRPSFNQVMVEYDGARYAELGDRPHIYLGPFAVNKAYRGRGIGSILLDYGFSMADAHAPPLPVVLHAFPNARPVYLHSGFEPSTLKDVPGIDAQMTRWGKSER